MLTIRLMIISVLLIGNCCAQTPLPGLAQKFAVTEKANSYTMRGKDIQAVHLEVASASITGTVNSITTSNYLSSIKGWYPIIGTTLTSQQFNLANTAANNITWTGTPTAGDGATTLNGTSQYGTLDNSNSALSITGQITLSCWIKPTNMSITTTQSIICRGGIDALGQIAYILGITTSRLYILTGTGTLFSGNIAGSTMLANGTQYHLAMTFTPSTSIIGYVNGVQDAISTTSITSTIQNAGTVAIGHCTQGNNYYYGGTISDVVIFNTALTAAQIKNLYNSQKAIKGY